MLKATSENTDSGKCFCCTRIQQHEFAIKIRNNMASRIVVHFYHDRLLTSMNIVILENG